MFRPQFLPLSSPAPARYSGGQPQRSKTYQICGKDKEKDDANAEKDIDDTTKKDKENTKKEQENVAERDQDNTNVSYQVPGTGLSFIVNM